MYNCYRITVGRLNVGFTIASRLLAYAYAGTVYSGQGKTLDETYLLHQRNWRDQSAYVAMTRAKDAAHLFVSKGSAENIDVLASQMGQRASLGASLNYSTTGDLNMTEPKTPKPFSGDVLRQQTNSLQERRAQFTESLSDYDDHNLSYIGKTKRMSAAQVIERDAGKNLEAAREGATTAKPTVKERHLKQKQVPKSV